MKPIQLNPALISLAAVLLLTPAVRWLARRFGFVAAPRPDRWHSKPTPMLGGISIFLGFFLALLFVSDFNKPIVGLLLGSAFMFALGLVDDIYRLSPFHKLVGVILASGIIMQSGLYLPWTPWMPVNVGFTIFWLVGITNAMNLLDNMDGLAPGIAMIASIFLAISFLIEGKIPEAILAAVFAGAVAGFLVYNFSPASVFMGDCGSMFLGFFLAGLTLMNGFGRSRNLLYVLAGPVLPFLTPIFDTTFVTISRLVSGRKVSQGGRDHTSHRLAAVAGSERNAVLILYGFAVLSGVIAVVVRLGYFSLSFALIPSLCLILAFLGVYLGRVAIVVPPGDRDVSFVRRLQSLLLQNGVVQVFLDSWLIFLAYYIAMLLRFEGRIPPGDLTLFFRTIRWFLVIKLTVFIWMGAYRHMWRFFGLSSLLVYAKAIAVSSAICVLVAVFLYRFQSLSRTIFVMDAVLLLCFIAGTRLSFRIFEAALKRPAPDNPNLKRTLIYGAGEMGSLLAKELEHNETLGYHPIGFIDDDPNTHLRSINGYRVFSGRSRLAAVLEKHSVQAVLVAADNLSEQDMEQIRQLCEKLQVSVKRMTIRIE